MPASTAPVVRREPDQASQGPTGIRSDQLPLTAGQPNAPLAAHRSLLADADPARRHSETPIARPRRVHHLAGTPAQDCWRIIETATRVRIAFAACCPEAVLFRESPTACSPQDRNQRGDRPDQARPSNLQRLPDMTGNRATRRRGQCAHADQTGYTKRCEYDGLEVMWSRRGVVIGGDVGAAIASPGNRGKRTVKGRRDVTASGGCGRPSAGRWSAPWRRPFFPESPPSGAAAGRAGSAAGRRISTCRARRPS